MFGYTKRRNSDTQGDWTGCPQLQRAFNYSQEPNIRCFVTKAGLSRVTRAMRGGGSQKVTNDDEGEGGGSRYPPKLMTSFMNSPVYHLMDIMMGNGEIWCKSSALVMVYIH